MFDPKTNKFPYPEYTDQHYLHVKKNDGTVFDKNYPYIDNSKSFKFQRFWLMILIRTLVTLVTYVRLGLKVEGRKNLKKYKDVIKNGVVSCCNHVHLFDYLAIMAATNPIKTNVLVWAPNIRGENGKNMRLLGGIPIPENDVQATISYFNAIDKLLNKGGWLHIYPEGSMWEFYAPIRPFKKGAAYFACASNKPIIPLAFSYREPNWIRKHIFKQIATFTLHIGEPIYPDNSLEKYIKEEELTKRVHKAICELAGINPKDNIYEPIFNHSKRIDYYTSTYGVNYKGSH